jgi:hypothetical protein
MRNFVRVTERIINLLEGGVIPWREQWASAGLPRILVSKKPYRGINSFLLAASKHVSPYWLTLKQANQLRGSVRKGEHGELVNHYRPLPYLGIVRRFYRCVDCYAVRMADSVVENSTEESVCGVYDHSLIWNPCGNHCEEQKKQ